METDSAIIVNEELGHASTTVSGINSIEEVMDSPTGQEEQVLNVEEEWLTYLNSPTALDEKNEEGSDMESFPKDTTAQQQQLPNIEEEGCVFVLQDQQASNRDEEEDTNMEIDGSDLNNDNQLEENLLEGPPPGFEEQQADCNQPRRSRRLSLKNKGPYVSSIQKARITQGYAGDESPQKQSKKRKTKSSNLKNEVYMQSSNPLTIEHAEAVVLTAGIQIGDELQKAIDFAIKEDANQGT